MVATPAAGPRLALDAQAITMPPGEMIQRGERPGGGKVDFAWLVFERDYPGSPSLRWLNRDQNKEPIT
jgi:hypothetical protein